VSTSAGTPPEPDNSKPPASATPGKDLRDSLWGRALILGVLLVFTVVVSRTCGSARDEVTQDEAITIAVDHASFVPCEQTGCVVVRALNQSIPTRLVWIVGLADQLDADGEPVRFENFEIDATTGAVTRRS
jgi:hypothetical protein